MEPDAKQRRENQESDTDPEDSAPAQSPLKGTLLAARYPSAVEKAAAKELKHIEIDPASGINADFEIQSLISDFVPVIDRDYSLEPDYCLGYHCSLLTPSD